MLIGRYHSRVSRQRRGDLVIKWRRVVTRARRSMSFLKDSASELRRSLAIAWLGEVP